MISLEGKQSENDKVASPESLPGVIKSDSPTPRATDFWGRASEK